MKKNVAIFHIEGNLYNNPSLLAMVEGMLERGHQVTYISPTDKKFSSPNINVFFLSRFKVFLYNIATERLCSSTASKMIIFLMTYSISSGNFDTVIGVDRAGLIFLQFFKRKKNINRIFLSFEIMFQSETSGRYKKLEKSASKIVNFWIAQDIVRGKILVEENNFDIKKLKIIPLGYKLRDKNRVIESKYKILDIPDGKKIALFMGSIDTWTMAEEIIESTINWPNEWVLLINPRYGLISKDYYALIQKINLVKMKIYISKYPSQDLDQLTYLINQVHCGLVFYRSINSIYANTNISKIGRSSGKLSMFSMCGKPVVTNLEGIASNDILHFKAGIVVKNISELPKSLQEIEEANLGEGAQNYFNSILNFQNYEKIFLDII